MTYQFPGLWNACVNQGWATPQTCSPAEFYTCVAAGEMYHAGKGRMNKYAKKALKKINKGQFEGNSVVPRLRDTLAGVVQRNQATLKVEEARRIEADNAKRQRETEIANLRAQLAKVQTALQTASSNSASCTSSLTDYQTRVKNLTEELRKEREANQSLEKRIDEIARQLETSQENTSELAKAFGEARRESSVYRGKVEEMESYLDRMTVEIANLNEKSAGHSREVERLRESQAVINDLLLNMLNRST